MRPVRWDEYGFDGDTITHFPVWEAKFGSKRSQLCPRLGHDGAGRASAGARARCCGDEAGAALQENNV